MYALNECCGRRSAFTNQEATIWKMEDPDPTLEKSSDPDP